MSERLAPAIITRNPERAALAMRGEHPEQNKAIYVGSMHFDRNGLTGLFALPDNLAGLWQAKEREPNKPFTTVTTVDCTARALESPAISAQVSPLVLERIGGLIRAAQADPEHVLNKLPFGFLLPADPSTTPDGLFGHVKVRGTMRPAFGLMFAPIHEAPFIQVHAHLKEEHPFYAGTSANLSGQGGGSGHSEMGHTLLDFGGKPVCFFMADAPENPDPMFRSRGTATREAQSTTMVYVDNDGSAYLVRHGSIHPQTAHVILDEARFGSFTCEEGQYAIAKPYDYSGVNLAQRVLMWSLARVAYQNAGEKDWLMTPQVHGAWLRAFQKLKQRQ